MYSNNKIYDEYNDYESMSMAEKQEEDLDYRAKLKTRLDKEILSFDEDMSKHTSFKAGGKAEIFICPRNKQELIETLEILSESGEKYMVIGNGSNILFKDEGYNGAVVKIGDAFSEIKIKDRKIMTGAGALLINVSRKACEQGLAGLEFAAGIPGSMGGAVFMNAGAYDEEMKGVVTEVRVLSMDGSDEKILFPSDLKFDYRSSAIQGSNYIVMGVTLELKYGEKDEVLAKAKRLNEQRNLKQPVEFPSAGSFFKRPKNNYAGKLIQDAGLRGFSIGGAKVSEKHAGFIINENKATATEIIELADEVQKKVKEKFGVALETEVRIIGD